MAFVLLGGLMTRRLLLWTLVEGGIALVVGVASTYLVSQRGDLSLQGWLDFGLLALMIAGALLAVWRPVDAAIAFGGMSWILVLLSLDSASAGKTADPLLAALCGAVLLIAAGVGFKASR